jgi:serine/threonine protein kinase
MLISEARVSALLRHSAIVQMYELGSVEGEHYIAMEYVDGLNLRTLLRTCAAEERHLPPGLACFIIKDVAAALHYAHSLEDVEGRALGIVHRDVSPSNVMISRAGTVKVLDFGIAKAAEHFRDDHTTTGALKGKISYMSPEQASAEPVDARSDIFSLGIVFWEALTNTRLFKGESDLHALRLIRETTPPPPSELAPGVDRDIDAIVGKMLARRREDRFASCQEVVDVLEPIIRRALADEGALARFVEGLNPDAASSEPPDLGELPPFDPVAGETRRIEPVVLVPGTAQDERPHTLTSSLPELTRTRVTNERRPLSRRWLAAAAAVAVVGTAVTVIGLLSPPSKGSTRQPAPPSPAPAVAAVALPAAPASGAPATTSAPQKTDATTPATTAAPRATIHVHVTGDRGARVLLNGKLLGTIPLDADLPRRHATATMLVTRPNYQTWRLGVALSNDLSVVVPHLTAITRARPRPASAPPEMLDPFHRK